MYTGREGGCVCAAVAIVCTVEYTETLSPKRFEKPNLLPVLHGQQ